MPPILDVDEVSDPGDTIVVKGEAEFWSRPPSTTDSSMNDVDIDVDHLLAQLNQNSQRPRLESPTDEDDGDEDPTASYATPNVNKRQSLSAHQRVAKPRSRLNAATMEERLVQMKEVRPLPWRDGVEAGAEVETGGESRRKQIRFGCLLATRGNIQEIPCNSCANGRGKFKHCIALDGFFKGACASCQLSGRPNRCSIKKNDDTIDSPTVDTPTETPIQRNPSQYLPTSDPPLAKRRKVSAAVPDWESARPQWEQELGQSQKTWATVNSPAPMATVPPNGMSGTRSRVASQSHSTEHRNSIGWAAVNQPIAGPLPQPPPNTTINSNGGASRSTTEQARQEEIILGDDVALIDTLPRAKQRMVFGLLSGLQAGINHLQSELDALKKALGIDDED